MEVIYTPADSLQQRKLVYLQADYGRKNGGGARTGRKQADSNRRGAGVIGPAVDRRKGVMLKKEGKKKGNERRSGISRQQQ